MLGIKNGYEFWKECRHRQIGILQHLMRYSTQENLLGDEKRLLGEMLMGKPVTLEEGPPVTICDMTGNQLMKCCQKGLTHLQFRDLEEQVMKQTDKPKMLDLL